MPSKWYSRLTEIKNSPNDELYTREEDVLSEVAFWGDFWRGKIVYLNCDAHDHSAFWKVFQENFTRLGLRRLIATCYCPGGRGVLAEYDGGAVEVKKLSGDGDFSSEECKRILDSADVVVTNPPFSLIRWYYPLVRDSGKRFLFVAPLLFWTYVCCRAEYGRGEFRPGNPCQMFVTKQGKLKHINAYWASNIGPAPVLPLPNGGLGGSLRDLPEFPGAWIVDSMNDFPGDSYDLLACPPTAARFLDPRKYEVLGVAEGGIMRRSALRTTGTRVFFRKKRPFEDYNRNEIILGAWSKTLWRRYKKVCRNNPRELWSVMRKVIGRVPLPRSVDVRVEGDFAVLTALKFSDVQRASYGLDGDIVYWDTTADPSVISAAKQWRDSIFQSVANQVALKFGDSPRLI